MAERGELKKGDKVKHGFRKNKYQRCVILEVEEGCNGLVKVICEDGFLKANEESTFTHSDLEKI